MKWHDSDDFWETFGPALFAKERWESAPLEIESVLGLAGTPTGAEVLDLCCGPGRHSLELARRGCRVTGVDRTARYLAQAAQMAKAEGLEIEFVPEDMRTFARESRFDLAISLYTSLGYFEDPDQDRQVLANVHRSLRPGGVFVLEMMGKEVLAWGFSEKDWTQLPDGSFMLEHRTLSGNWGRMESRWILIRDGQVREHRVDHRLYSGTELESALREAGFATVEIFGTLAGAPYDQNANRLVALATRS